MNLLRELWATLRTKTGLIAIGIVAFGLYDQFAVVGHTRFSPTLLAWIMVGLGLFFARAGLHKIFAMQCRLDADLARDRVDLMQAIERAAFRTASPGRRRSPRRRARPPQNGRKR